METKNNKIKNFSVFTFETVPDAPAIIAQLLNFSKFLHLNNYNNKIYLNFL